MILHGVKEIGQLLNCSRHKIYTLIEAGAPIRVTGSENGNRYLADSETLLQWVRSPPAIDGNK